MKKTEERTTAFNLNALSIESTEISKKRARNGGTKTFTVQNVLKHCATEVVEAMEACTEYKTCSAEKADEAKEAFVSELADIVVCCMIVAGHEGIDLETALIKCVEKNRLRAEGKGDKK